MRFIIPSVVYSRLVARCIYHQLYNEINVHNNSKLEFKTFYSISFSYLFIYLFFFFEKGEHHIISFLGPRFRKENAINHTIDNLRSIVH